MTMPFNHETLAHARHQELLSEADAARLADRSRVPRTRFRARLARTLYQLATWLAPEASQPAVSYQPSPLRR